MSYKHNNLMAMREKYWSDNASHHVQNEKRSFVKPCKNIKFLISLHLTMRDTSFYTPEYCDCKRIRLGFYSRFGQEHDCQAY